MPYDTDELTKMSRRRFAEALAGMGLSAGVVHHMTQDALAEQTDDPSKEVPRLFGRRVKNPEERKDKPPSPDDRPEMEERWYTIPRSKWVRVETAEDACLELQNQMNELDDTGQIDVYVANQHDRDGSEKLLQVVYTTSVWEKDGEQHERTPDVSFERVEEEAPYTVTGIAGEGDNREERDVEVEVIRTEKTADCDPDGGSYYDHYYDNIPSGAQTDSCTTGPPAYSNDYSDYVITTAGHCYDLWDTIEQPNGSDAATVDDDESFLETNDDIHYSDMCFGRPESGRTVHYYIASDEDDNEYDEYIAGTVSWTRIKDIQDSTFETLEKQGATTHRCGGTVLTTHPGDVVRSMEIEAPRAGGDSGGPYFDLSSDGYAYIAGHHIRQGQDYDWSEGAFWEDQYERLGLKFQ